MNNIVGLICDNEDEAIEELNDEEADALLSELLGIDEKQYHHHTSRSGLNQNRSHRPRASSHKAAVPRKQEYQKV